MTTDWNFQTLFWVMNILYGVYSALGAIISFLAAPYYSLDETTYLGAGFLISGIIASFVVGVILDKFRCYKKAQIWLTIQSIVAQAVFFYSLPSRNFALAFFNASVIGASLLPISVVSFTLGAELTYPMHESLSAGYLLTWSQFFGVIVAYVAGYLTDINPNYANLLLVILLLCAVPFAFLTKETLGR